MLWRVVDHTAGAVDQVVLGDQPNDSYRIVVDIIGHGRRDVPEVDTLIVYPCAACGWEGTCGPAGDGEDCHS